MKRGATGLAAAALFASVFASAAARADCLTPAVGAVTPCASTSPSPSPTHSTQPSPAPTTQPHHSSPPPPPRPASAPPPPVFVVPTTRPAPQPSVRPSPYCFDCEHIAPNPDVQNQFDQSGSFRALNSYGFFGKPPKASDHYWLKIIVALVLSIGGALWLRQARVRAAMIGLPED